MRINFKQNSLSAIRYAAYTLTDRAYVKLGLAGKDTVAIDIVPKNSNELVKNLEKELLLELKDEKFREVLRDRNMSVCEHLIRKALIGDTVKHEEKTQALTKDQEKELDDLIAEVERELKAETEKQTDKSDPLGITKTWEDKNAK